MRKKFSPAFFYYLLFGLPAAALIFFVSFQIRDKKFDTANSRIRNLEELVTARQIFRDVIYTEVRENFIVDKRSLFTINYVVTAGSDLSGGISLKSKRGRISLVYPYPRILGIDADESSIDQFFSVERFGKIKQSDYLNALYDEKERIRKEALDSGILERADMNLRNLITGILKEADIDNVKFESYTKEGETNEVQ